MRGKARKRQTIGRDPGPALRDGRNRAGEIAAASPGDAAAASVGAEEVRLAARTRHAAAQLPSSNALAMNQMHAAIATANAT